jgi:hypothetical protein
MSQNLFKANPGALARYIREDIDWTNGQDLKQSPQEVETLFTSLWGISPQITLPFDQSSTNKLMEEETIQGVPGGMSNTSGECSIC